MQTHTIPLNPEEIKSIRSSFLTLLSFFNDGSELAGQIYQELFKQAPAARAMFSADMIDQKRKLSTMLLRLVSHLEEPEKFYNLLVQLGKSHASYNVREEHYILLKDVLLDVFKKNAPDVFDNRTLATWAKLYDAVAHFMLQQSR